MGDSSAGSSPSVRLPPLDSAAASAFEALFDDDLMAPAPGTGTDSSSESATAAALEALFDNELTAPAPAPAPASASGTTTSGPAARRGPWSSADFTSFGDPEAYL